MIVTTAKDTPKETQEKDYPYVGKSSNTGTIVLFTGEGKGVVLVNAEYWGKLGYYSAHWVEADFTAYDGEVIVKNK
jgi:hypothetical protein